MTDIKQSYFDVKCDEHGFYRDYLQYLHPRNLEIVLEVCSYPKRSKKKIIEDINKKDRVFNSRKFDKKLIDIRHELISLNRYAELFGITDTIKPYTQDALMAIVEDWYNKQD